MGSMRQRGAGSWRIKAYVGRDPVTSRKRYVERTVKGKKREAKRALAKLVTEVSEGRVANSGASHVRRALRSLARAQGAPARPPHPRRLPVGDRAVSLEGRRLDEDQPAADGRPRPPIRRLTPVRREKWKVTLASDRAAVPWSNAAIAGLGQAVGNAGGQPGGGRHPAEECSQGDRPALHRRGAEASSARPWTGTAISACSYGFWPPRAAGGAKLWPCGGGTSNRVWTGGPP